VNPKLGEPGTGPPEIDGILEQLRAMEAKMRGGAGGNAAFFMRDPPAADRLIRLPAESRLVSYVSRGVRYLLTGRRARGVGFGVAVSCADLSAVRLGDDGRLSCPLGISIGVTPFIAMPPEGMLAAKAENERRYRDKAGHGFHLPTFVEAYTDLLAFTVQATPVALGALLLCEPHPRAAEELMAEHGKIAGAITSAALYFLGYEQVSQQPDGPPRRRFLRDSQVSQACGMRLVEALHEWPRLCCKSPILAAFAQSYAGLCLDKIPDVLARSGL
jgi:hypothetical protein